VAADHYQQGVDVEPVTTTPGVTVAVRCSETYLAGLAAARLPAQPRPRLPKRLLGSCGSAVA
jgi:hypothetical protein